MQPSMPTLLAIRQHSYVIFLPIIRLRIYIYIVVIYIFVQLMFCRGDTGPKCRFNGTHVHVNVYGSCLVFFSSPNVSVNARARIVALL